MFDFGPYIDLPFIWAGIIGFAIFVYIILDGFDLGTGILFPFAPSDECRNKMIMSIAPFWDGNETWLVLGGGGLFAAFPYAYSIVMPGFYMPIIIMLLALIFRGVSFEFMFKTSGHMKKFWGYAFHFGSLAATFCQGMILGGFIEGISMVNGKSSGVPYDWFSAFSLFCGIAITFSYALIGSTWLIMKTADITHDWAKKVTFYISIYVFLFTGAISLFSPLLNEYIYNRWFTSTNLLLIGWLPLLVIFGFIYLYRTLYNLTEKNDHYPFFITIGIFTLCCIGLAFSIWPYIVPYQITIWQGAASSRSLSLLLVGAVLVVPMILFYTAYTYYVFRGKTEVGTY
jgi:cytochrome d ubiquinol oxidase subunit II